MAPTAEFNDEITKYPVRFAHPVYFGDSTLNARANLANGSGCLLLLGGRLLGVTCHHVLAGYKSRRTAASTVFQFGPIRFEPEERVISESQSLDLVTFDLTDYLDAEINGVERAKCIEPTEWPPRDIGRDDVMAFAGFPGAWREQPGLNHLRFYSFSSGTTEIEAIGNYHLVARIRLDLAEVTANHGLVYSSIRGLSGGPAFVWRKTPILIAELVGFITEYHESFDLLYIRRASCINSDGRIIDSKI